MCVRGAGGRSSGLLQLQITAPSTHTHTHTRTLSSAHHVPGFQSESRVGSRVKKQSSETAVIKLEADC